MLLGDAARTITGGEASAVLNVSRGNHPLVSIAILHAILSQGVAYAQLETNQHQIKITGNVCSIDGKPIDHAQIEVIGVSDISLGDQLPTRSDYTTIAVAVSSPKGDFHLLTTSWPRVVIRARHPSFEDGAVNVQGSDGNVSVTITLERNAGSKFIARVCQEKTKETRAIAIKNGLRNVANPAQFLEQAFPEVSKLSDSLIATEHAIGFSGDDVQSCETLLMYATYNVSEPKLIAWLHRDPGDNERSFSSDQKRGRIDSDFDGALDQLAATIAVQCGAPTTSKATVFYDKCNPSRALIATTSKLLMLPTMQVYERWHVVVEKRNAVWKVIFWRHLQNAGTTSK